MRVSFITVLSQSLGIINFHTGGENVGVTGNCANPSWRFFLFLYSYYQIRYNLPVEHWSCLFVMNWKFICQNALECTLFSSIFALIIEMRTLMNGYGGF